MTPRPPTLKRILLSALAALTVGLGAVSLIVGFSDSFVVRLLQGLAVFAAGAVVLGGAVVLALVRLAAWRDPESEEESLLDPYNEEDFRALVRSALDDPPLEFHRALEHVAVVVSDRGRRRRAYGLYQGDTVASDYFHERIVIFRDTLLRDFGHDPELLRDQVTRTVRHELAHHLGWDEKGVRGLGL